MNELNYAIDNDEIKQKRKHDLMMTKCYHNKKETLLYDDQKSSYKKGNVILR